MLFLMLDFNASKQEQTINLMGQEFAELLLININFFLLLAVNVLHCGIYAFNVNKFQNARNVLHVVRMQS